MVVDCDKHPLSIEGAPSLRGLPEGARRVVYVAATATVKGICFLELLNYVISTVIPDIHRGRQETQKRKSSLRSLCSFVAN